MSVVVAAAAAALIVVFTAEIQTSYDCGQIVCTFVPLSASSINWFRQKLWHLGRLSVFAPAFASTSSCCCALARICDLAV